MYLVCPVCRDETNGENSEEFAIGIAKHYVSPWYAVNTIENVHKFFKEHFWCSKNPHPGTHFILEYESTAK